MIRFGMLLSLLGTALMLLGGFFCFALLIYGIYVLFVKSVIIGLIAIGASCVLTFLVRLDRRLVSGLHIFVLGCQRMTHAVAEMPWIVFARSAGHPVQK